MNLNINEVLASKWMAITDLPEQGVDLQILNVTKEAVGEMLEDKIAVHFNAGYKPMLANRTNLRILSALFGPHTQAWLGKVVNVYNDPTVSYGGRITGGVRVRPAQAAAHQPHNNLPAAPQAPNYPGHQDNPASYQPAATPQQYRQASGGAFPNALTDDIPF